MWEIRGVEDDAKIGLRYVRVSRNGRYAVFVGCCIAASGRMAGAASSFANEEVAVVRGQFLEWDRLLTTGRGLAFADQMGATRKEQEAAYATEAEALEWRRIRRPNND